MEKFNIVKIVEQLKPLIGLDIKLVKRINNDYHYENDEFIIEVDVVGITKLPQIYEPHEFKTDEEVVKFIIQTCYQEEWRNIRINEILN